MTPRLKVSTLSGAAFLAAMMLLACPSTGRAQGAGLNPDNLSFLEEPLAFPILGFTAYFNHLIDLPVVHDFKSDDTDIYPRTNFRWTIERQLPNALTVGATYFGSFDDREADEYEDRWALYGSGVWGRLSFGEVNETVREATRRWRGTGNAELEFDDVVGTLEEDDLGVAYFLRVSAYTLNVGVDENGNSDVGITYERPSANVDIRFTGRLTNSEAWSLDGRTRFDTHAGGIVGQIEYGSFAADAGIGYERFNSRTTDGDRFYLSAGLHYKVRRLTLSAEGHYGEIDGNPERSAALGLRYDIARGLSANLGYNWAWSEADIGGIAIRRLDISEILGSLRYEY